jgi:hypothetical protein
MVPAASTHVPNATMGSAMFLFEKQRSAIAVPARTTMAPMNTPSQKSNVAFSLRAES